ncbi:hypothetical protein PM082_022950 [Marasmius tenuissimus]|nr:hypothetical protein PM082_022950 [Marasmius tenuissimus]
MWCTTTKKLAEGTVYKNYDLPSKQTSFPRSAVLAQLKMAGSSQLFSIHALVSGAVLFNQLLTIPVVTTILTGSLFDEKEHKIAISLVNLLAAASQALITFCLWYSFKSHMDEASSLNIRLNLLEQPRLDEESRRNSVLEPSVYVRVSTPAGSSPSMEHINQARHPVSAVDTRPVEPERVVVVPSDLRNERRADTKEIRMEWTPPRPQDDSDLFSPASQDMRFMPALAPNRSLQ